MELDEIGILDRVFFKQLQYEPNKDNPIETIGVGIVIQKMAVSIAVETTDDNSSESRQEKIAILEVIPEGTVDPSDGQIKPFKEGSNTTGALTVVGGMGIAAGGVTSLNNRYYGIVKAADSTDTACASVRVGDSTIQLSTEQLQTLIEALKEKKND